MGFIVGKAYPIIKSMADSGNQEAKNLLSGLEKMDQSKVDEMVSSLLGGGGNNKPSSFTDVATGEEALPKTVGEQEEMKTKLDEIAASNKKTTKLLELGDTDDIPKGVMPKTAAEEEELRNLLSEISTSNKNKIKKVSPTKDPLGEENLQELFDAGLDVDEVIDKVRVQMKDVQLNPDDPMGDGDLQSVVEAFEMSYKPKSSYKTFKEIVGADKKSYSSKLTKKEEDFLKWARTNVDKVSDEEVISFARGLGIEPNRALFIRAKVFQE